MIDLRLRIAIGSAGIGDAADVYTNAAADGRCGGAVRAAPIGTARLWPAGDDPASRGGRIDAVAWLAGDWLSEPWLSDRQTEVEIAGLYFGPLRVEVVGRDAAGNQAEPITSELWINSGPDPVRGAREIAPPSGRAVALRYEQPPQLIPLTDVEH